MMWMLPTPAGKLMPTDVGSDPAGTLLGIMLPGGVRGVRVMTAAELADPPPGPRFTPHWVTCPHANAHRQQRRASVREGNCAACAGPNPNRYGEGGSPFCPACRQTRGLPPVV